jgi:hypothetical protein
MKVRIQGNSIRMRLSKSNVEQLIAQGVWTEQIAWGAEKLCYSVERDEDATQMTSTFIDNKITIHIPKSFLEDWDINDIVGFSEEQSLPNDNILYILVEKDFKCTDNTNQDQSDFYENPNLLC